MTKLELMNFCWVRGLDWYQADEIAKQLNVELPIPSREDFNAFCTKANKEMDEFFDGFTEEEINDIGKELFK